MNIKAQFMQKGQTKKLNLKILKKTITNCWSGNGGALDIPQVLYLLAKFNFDN